MSNDGCVGSGGASGLVEWRVMAAVGRCGGGVASDFPLYRKPARTRFELSGLPLQLFIRINTHNPNLVNVKLARSR